MSHTRTFLFCLAFSAASSAAVAQAPAQPGCTDCGVVQSIRFVEEQQPTSGLGMIGGAVVGGVIGHQIGSGRGNTVATVAGAAGGGYVGNQVEKNRNTKTYWSVAIKMDGGNTRTFTYTNKPSVNEGERVKLVDGGRRLALVAN